MRKDLVTRNDIIGRIQAYLDGQLSGKELEQWALDFLVRERENYSIEGIIIGEAIGSLSMPGELERIGLTDSDLENLKDILRGEKSYQLKRLIQKDFTPLCEELSIKINETIESLGQGASTDLNELLDKCKKSEAATVHGLLLRHIASLIETISMSIRSDVVKPYVLPDLAESISHVSTDEILKQLKHAYGCLKGQKAFVLTIVGEPGYPHQAHFVIS